MVDREAFIASLDGQDEIEVRTKLAMGNYGEAKKPLVEEWLRRRRDAPKAIRRWRDDEPVSAYRPTAGDMAYRQAFMANPEINPFDEAVALSGVSDAYLSVLAHDNAGESSAAFRAMIDAEVTRRGSALSKRANLIAWISLAIAVVSAVISIVK
jgi:hypothetical protein